MFLRKDTTHSSWKRNAITDVFQLKHPSDEAIHSNSKSRVLYTTISSDIDIPLVLLWVITNPVQIINDELSIGLTFTSTNNLSKSSRAQEVTTLVCSWIILVVFHVDRIERRENYHYLWLDIPQLRYVCHRPIESLFRLFGMILLPQHRSFYQMVG